jgi:hypothetical protein
MYYLVVCSKPSTLQSEITNKKRDEKTDHEGVHLNSFRILNGEVVNKEVHL